MADSTVANSHVEFDDPQRGYRTVEPWAVGGLVLGFVSAVAMWGGLLWLMAGVGVAANVVALRRLKNDANHSGRGAALCGLALSIIFGVAPAAQMAAAHVVLGGQARQVADQFLEFLREDSPEKAEMLRYQPDQRRAFDDLLWTYFRGNAESARALRRFVEQPVVRTLLALGPRAEVRFYKTGKVITEGTRGLVHYYYTVTFPEDGGKKTFFVDIIMERKPTKKPNVNPWQVLQITGGGDPRNGLQPKNG